MLILKRLNMPQKRSAYKELRKSKRKHIRNVKAISEVRSLIKKYNALLLEKKFDDAKVLLRSVTSKMAKAAAKGIIRKNTASRKLSRLSKSLSKAKSSK